VTTTKTSAGAGTPGAHVKTGATNSVGQKSTPKGADVSKKIRGGEYMTVAEAAAATNRSEIMWRNRAAGRAGYAKIPGAFQAGRDWLIPVAYVEAYIANPPTGGRPVSTGAGLKLSDRRHKRAQGAAVS